MLISYLQHTLSWPGWKQPRPLFLKEWFTDHLHQIFQDRVKACAYLLRCPLWHECTLKFVNLFTTFSVPCHIWLPLSVMSIPSCPPVETKCSPHHETSNFMFTTNSRCEATTFVAMGWMRWGGISSGVLQNVGEHWNVTCRLEWWEGPVVCIWNLGTSSNSA